MTDVKLADLPTVSMDDYDPSDAVTLVDLAEAHGVNRMTANKRLAQASVLPVAKLQTGKAGRPPALFPRSAADEAVTSTAGDVVAQAAADALAE